MSANDLSDAEAGQATTRHIDDLFVAALPNWRAYVGTVRARGLDERQFVGVVLDDHGQVRAWLCDHAGALRLVADFCYPMPPVTSVVRATPPFAVVGTRLEGESVRVHVRPLDLGVLEAT